MRFHLQLFTLEKLKCICIRTQIYCNIIYHKEKSETTPTSIVVIAYGGAAYNYNE